MPALNRVALDAGFLSLRPPWDFCSRQCLSWVCFLFVCWFGPLHPQRVSLYYFTSSRLPPLYSSRKPSFRLCTYPLQTTRVQFQASNSREVRAQFQKHLLSMWVGVYRGGGREGRGRNPPQKLRSGFCILASPSLLVHNGYSPNRQTNFATSVCFLLCFLKGWFILHFLLSLWTPEEHLKRKKILNRVDCQRSEKKIQNTQEIERKRTSSKICTFCPVSSN